MEKQGECQMNIKIKNSDIQSFVELLFEMPLKGSASRMRTRFIRLLEERYLMIVEEAETLQKEYAKKDESGEIIYKTVKMPDGESVEGFDFEDLDSYQREVAKLMEEEYVISITPEIDKMLISVKESVLNSDLELSGHTATAYDSLCEILESI